jgi:hypothetical protein
MLLRIPERLMSAASLFWMAWIRNSLASVATTKSVPNRRLILPRPSRLAQQNIFSGDEISSSYRNDSSSSGVGLVVVLGLVVLFTVIAVWILWYVRNQHQREVELSKTKTHISSKNQTCLKDKSMCSDDTLSNTSGVDESFDMEMARNVTDVSNVFSTTFLSKQSTADGSIIMSSEAHNPVTNHESERSRRLSFLLDSIDSCGGIDCDDDLYSEVHDHGAMNFVPLVVDDDVELTTDSFDDTTGLTRRYVTDSPIAEPILIFNDDEEHMDHSRITTSRFLYGDETTQISAVDDNLNQGHTNDSIYESAHKLLSLLSFSKPPPCDSDNIVVSQPPWAQRDEIIGDSATQAYTIQKRQSRRKRRRSTETSSERFPDDDSDCSSMEEQAWIEFQQPTQDESMKSMEDVMVEWNSNPHQRCGQQLLPVPLSLGDQLSSPRPPSMWVSKRVPLHTTTKVEL